jgi:hypothetical protein
MKEIFIIGSYCDTAPKLAALERLLDQIREIGLPTVVFGRYPIPERVQKKCDYWIYDRSNPILEDRALNHWLVINDKRISNLFFDFAYAALEQIIKTLGFVKNLNYDIAHWLNYDVDLQNFRDFRKASVKSLIESNKSAACVRFMPISDGNLRGINTTSISFKVNEAHSKLVGVMTQSFYRMNFEKNGDYIAEDFIEDCFRVAELDHEILPASLAPHATLTSTGLRKHGQVPETFTKTRKYFHNFFVGLNSDTGKASCYAWNLQEPVNKLRIDFGNGMIGNFNVIGGTFEEQIDFFPTRCKILEINGQPVNEILDHEFSENYWKMNKIETNK